MSPVDFFGGPFTQRVNVRYRDIEMTNAAVQGASPSYFKMGVTNIAEGRYFTDEENARHANVLVIGRDVANTLFPFSNAIDQQMSINGRGYRVVGVLGRARCFPGRRRRSEQRKQGGLHALPHLAETLSGSERQLRDGPGAPGLDATKRSKRFANSCVAGGKLLLAVPTILAFQLQNKSSRSLARLPAASLH